MSQDMDQKRVRARRLREEGRSIRQIGATLGVSKTTVHRWLEEDSRREMHPAALANIQTPDGRPVAGAEPGNTRALKHGLDSERVLAPLRARYAAELAREYPDEPEPVRMIQAQRLAQIETGTAWLDKQETVVMDSDGHVFDVANRVAAWSQTAERWYADAEERAKAVRKPQSSVIAMQGGVDDE